MANDLLVACPMQLTTTVKRISIASNEPVNQQQSTGTNFISWLYTDVTNTTSANCTKGTRNELTEGKACLAYRDGARKRLRPDWNLLRLGSSAGETQDIPGTSVQITRIMDELNVTSGSETGMLYINETSNVRKAQPLSSSAGPFSKSQTKFSTIAS